MKQPLVTILTAPKAFVDPHIQVIQKNALRSWKALGDAVDIIVLGSDEGVKENVRSLGIRHYPNVTCNEKGTPLISSMLEIGRKESTSPYLAIVNADIILFSDFLRAIRDVSKVYKKFLIVGQRWDMDITKEIGEKKLDFSRLRKCVREKAILHPPTGSDYFIFPRSCYQSIPDFAIGRAGWDNWFIYKSRWEGWPIIDGTHDVMIVHQTHNYAHLPGGRPHYRLPETLLNVKMGGGDQTVFFLQDAHFDLSDHKLVKKKLTWKKFLREIEIYPLSRRRSQFFGKLFFYIFNPKKAYTAFRKWLRKHG
ncbi:MAG: hypothetical protein J7L66_03610 [Anaerolineaceae bacterium]|nr:hypothetical protein [Anaerolineaceae bacterium]